MKKTDFTIKKEYCPNQGIKGDYKWTIINTVTNETLYSTAMGESAANHWIDNYIKKF